DPVADGELAHSFADRDDGACHFQPEDGACIRRRRIFARALGYIRTVDACRLHLDDDLARARLRRRPGRYMHDLRPAEARQIDVTHLLRKWHGSLLVLEQET